MIYCLPVNTGVRYFQKIEQVHCLWANIFCFTLRNITAKTFIMTVLFFYYGTILSLFYTKLNIGPIYVASKLWMNHQYETTLRRSATIFRSAG